MNRSARLLLQLSARQQMLACRHLRIACASGFWGDTMASTTQLVHSAEPVDYIVYDYLSEITMSLLARAKTKQPNMGYCPDFVLAHMRPNLATIKKQGIRIVSNAGGLNPSACAVALRQLCKEQNVPLSIATVDGDDLWSDAETRNYIADAVRSAPDAPQKLASINTVNAYLGTEPLLQSLASGADIVITGRCVDSALVLAPLMHKYMSDASSQLDYDKMAMGSLAGHLIECGAQVTGGIFTDWRNVNDWQNIGFPIVEFDDAKGMDEFVVTKPPRTGGTVNTGTVAEQLVYEIGDPAKYLLPDVTCDFSNVQLTQAGDNRVRVTGARGSAPPATLKCTGTYTDGYRVTAAATVIGGDAAAKARRTAEAIIARLSRKLLWGQIAVQEANQASTLGLRMSYYVKKYK